jgi:uncharacterized membrane protein YdjX (TVP38/TMEM64 family)
MISSSGLMRMKNVKEETGFKADSSIPFVKILIFLIFAGGFAAFFALGGNRYLNFHTLKANRDLFLMYTRNNYWMMLFLVVLIYTISTALSIPAATILSLATGFLFGRWIGMVVIAFSATLGATLIFLSARYVFAEAAQRRIGPAAKKIISAFHKNDFNYLLFLRLVPLFPFWLVNLASAFTPVKVRTYVLATAIGIVPATFVFANLGGSLGHIDSPDQLLSSQTIGALVLLGILALVPVLIKRSRARNTPRET